MMLKWSCISSGNHATSGWLGGPGVYKAMLNDVGRWHLIWMAPGGWEEIGLTFPTLRAAKNAADEHESKIEREVR